MEKSDSATINTQGTQGSVFVCFGTSSDLSWHFYTIGKRLLTQLILSIGNFENCFHLFLGMSLCCIVWNSI